MLKLYCTVPGLEENWIELPERWTLRDQREIEQADRDAFLDLLRRKVVAIHLITEDGDVLDEPAALTEERLEGLDVRLDQFLATVMQSAILMQRRLGNFSARPSSNGSGTRTPQTTAA